MKFKEGGKKFDLSRSVARTRLVDGLCPLLIGVNKWNDKHATSFLAISFSTGGLLIRDSYVVIKAANITSNDVLSIHGD